MLFGVGSIRWIFMLGVAGLVVSFGCHGVWYAVVADAGCIDCNHRRCVMSVLCVKADCNVFSRQDCIRLVNVIDKP